MMDLCMTGVSCAACVRARGCLSRVERCNVSVCAFMYVRMSVYATGVCISYVNDVCDNVLCARSCQLCMCVQDVMRVMP